MIAEGRVLRGKSLDGADLRGLNLSRVLLDRVTLRGADLSGAVLSGATLRRVDLTDARLDGADLQGITVRQALLLRTSLDNVDARGALLADCKLTTVTSRGLRADGARLTDVGVLDSRFEGMSLAGAALTNVTLGSVVIEEGSFVGMRASDCTLEGGALQGCDLRSATFERASISGTKISECQLRAALFREARFSRVDWGSGDWSGAVFDLCRGIELERERTITEAGARFEHGIWVRMGRRVRGSRPLQVAVASTVVLTIAGLVVVAYVPSMQPTLVLATRLSALPPDPSVETCSRVLALGAPLSERTGHDPTKRMGIFERMADCQRALGHLDLAADLLREAVGIADHESDRMGALLLLSHVLMESKDLDAARDTALQAEDLASTPDERVRVLRLKAEILAAQGGHATARSPGTTPAAGDEWLDLQLAIADEIEKAPSNTRPAPENTPSDLYVLGEWDRADRLLSGDPNISAAQAWSMAQTAVERIVQSGDVDLAVALLDHFYTPGALTTTDELARFRSQVEILIRVGRTDRVAGLLADQQGATDPIVLAELTLLRGKLLLATQQPAAAAALLLGSPLASGASYDLTCRFAWALADAQLRSGNESGAVEALGPMLRAVTDPSDAADLTRRLAEWSTHLSQPGLLIAALDAAGNPLLEGDGRGQAMQLARLALQVRAGPVSAQDPTYLSVLASGSPEESEQALRLMASGIAGQGDIVAQLDTLVAQAAAMRNADSRGRAGITLAQFANSDGRPDKALDVITKMQLEQAPLAQVRTAARELRAGIQLDRGQVDDVIAEYHLLSSSPDAVDDAASFGLRMRVAQALQGASRWSEALPLIRSLRSGDHATDPDLWKMALTSLAGASTAGEFESEAAAAARVLPPCQTQAIAAEAWMDRGLGPPSLSALEQECTRDDATPGDRLAAARDLHRGGATTSAVRVLQAVDTATVSNDVRWQVDCDLASYLSEAGRRAEGLAVLEAGYLGNPDPQGRERVTAAIVDILAAEKQPDPMVAAYARLAADQPNADLAPLRAHVADLLDQLGATGQAHKFENSSPPSAEQNAPWSDAFQELAEAHDYARAWDSLDAARASVRAYYARADLISRAEWLEGQSGDPERLIALLVAMEPELGRPSTLSQAADLARARALTTAGRSADAEAILVSLMGSDLPTAQRVAALQAYGQLLGRYGSSSRVEPAVAHIVGAHHGSIDEQVLRAAAAQELGARNEPTAALALLEPLAGLQLDPSVVGPVQGTAVGASIATRQFDLALTVPTRFPSPAGVCAAWVSIAQAMPPDQPQAQRARDAAVTSCDPTWIPADSAIALSNALVSAEPERGLGVIEKALQNTHLWPRERDSLVIQQARLLAASGRTEDAKSTLRKLAQDPERPDVGLQAGMALIRVLQAEKAPNSSAEVGSVADDCLARLGPELPPRRDLFATTVEALRTMQAWKPALAWDTRRLELFPNPDNDRAAVLSDLALLEFRANPGAAGALSSRGHAYLIEALGIGAASPQVRADLTGLDIAWRAAQAGPGDEHLRPLVQAALADNEGPVHVERAAQFLDELARPELASAIRTTAAALAKR